VYGNVNTEAVSTTDRVNVPCGSLEP